jgi:glycine oxidase
MLAGVFESAESGADKAVVGLARRGLACWRDWSTDLGRDAIGYRAAGSLSPASGKAGRDWLERLEDAARRQGFRVEHVPVPDGLVADAALRFPDDGELDNRLLGPHLVAALRERGVDIHENRTVDSIDIRPSGGIDLRFAGMALPFDAAILATGHDAGLAPIDPAISAIVPVKGEMLSLREAAVGLDACVRARSVYMSQKPDRRIVIGASSWFGANDLAIDDSAISRLRRHAEALLPQLAGATELERWAGIRPGTKDGLPILGESRAPGVFLALGLYRNGVLYSPAVAEMLADTILNGRPFPSGFSPRRFDER